jgi:hypothetical protein
MGDKKVLVKKASFRCGSKQLNKVIWDSHLDASEKTLFNDKLEDNKEDIPDWQRRTPTGPPFLKGRGAILMQKLVESGTDLDQRCVSLIAKFCEEAFPGNKEKHLLCLTGGSAGMVTNRRTSLGGEETCVITTEGLPYRQVITRALPLFH